MRRSGAEFCGSACAGQGFASPLPVSVCRALDSPGALPRTGHYRSAASQDPMQLSNCPISVRLHHLYELLHVTVTSVESTASRGVVVSLVVNGGPTERHSIRAIRLPQSGPLRRSLSGRQCRLGFWTSVDT
jgi:hypothetical protein